MALGGGGMTAQIHERLIFDGEETSMAFCPPLPENHPRVVTIDFDKVERGDGSVMLFSTACWRHYQGTWEIRDRRFYLKALRGRFQLRGDGPLLADWFSGALRIPKGKTLVYVHMGFGSVYEQEIHVQVRKGIVTSVRVIDNRGWHFDEGELGWRNLPGGENRFPGDEPHDGGVSPDSGGRSPQRAISVRSDREEYDWFVRNLQGARLVDKALCFFDGKPFHVLTFAVGSGDERRVFFDISSFYGRERESRPPDAPRPYCGAELRTAKAKQCFECGMDWHDPAHIIHRGSA
jgi:hypothetical protein